MSIEPSEVFSCGGFTLRKRNGQGGDLSQLFSSTLDEPRHRSPRKIPAAALKELARTSTDQHGPARTATIVMTSSEKVVIRKSAKTGDGRQGLPDL